MINNLTLKIGSYNSGTAVDLCNKLIADFMAFYEGRLSDMKMVDHSKLERDEPPTTEQLGKCLAVARAAWHDLRRAAGLPGECDGLLERKLKKQWKDLEKSRKCRKSKRS